MKVTEGLSHIDKIVIDSQFCGPPGSGNGGYVCGRLAHYFDGPATVRLMAPPPLDTSLDVFSASNEIELHNGDAVIGRAWAGGPGIGIPAAPALEAARQRRKMFAGYKHHTFPGCFVCGTARTEGDGLMVYTGPESDPTAFSQAITNHVAGNWSPHESFCDEDGVLLPEFVWSALDCPSGWSFLSSGEEVALLGEFSVEINQPIHCGQDYIVAGWEYERSGRKRLAGAAIYDAAGLGLAWSRATWITINHP